MGVPKFYRWISERYPCLSEVINDSEIPEFDNLYLDMNGIIHNCSHPDENDIVHRIPQEQIFDDIFAYVDTLFNIIRPKKVFFLAVDGVAPRAKMNQQRGRRFMSARTAEEQLQTLIRKGGKIPAEEPFDSNCITPGTIFMSELQQALSAWLSTKVEKDTGWKHIRVYLSGHDCPGEGEHKIMDFIRHERSLEGYDPNTKHCMYGLDADLIMLGLCSHEPHFSLLREEVKFGRSKSKKSGVSSPYRINPNQIKFHLLHLSLLREYLSWEFHSLKATLPFPYDVDHVVDDWVLMGFLVGNDFIPHLPHVHIHEDALPLLYQTYIQVLPTLDGYINESGILHLKRFEIFLKAFAANDRRYFLQKCEDERYLRSKTGNYLETKNSRAEEDLSPASSRYDRAETTEESLNDEAAFVSSDESEIDAVNPTAQIPDGGLQSASVLLEEFSSEESSDDDKLCSAIMAVQLREMDDKLFENDIENCWTKTVKNSFRRHKRDYYRDKMKFGNITKSELRDQAEGYVRAVQWNLHYYYRGCVSWNWFYPHHYAPYISDVVDFSDMDITFELGEPFKPFEQLLAVLPTASSECLPPSLRELMCNKESPIADFYPTEFLTDLNGKKNDWESVVLLPFIDEKRLLSAMESKMPLLTPEEKSRNSFGNILVFTPSCTDCSKCSKLPIDAFHLDPQCVKWGLLPNVKLDVYFPGFPTMKHLPHSAELKQVNAKVFNQESKRPSMVLSVKKRDEFGKNVMDVAKNIIDKEVYIDWPILKLAVVDCLWAGGRKYTRKDGLIEEFNLNDEEKDVMSSTLRSEKERLLSRFAIDVGQCDTIVFVRRFVGINYIVQNGKLRPRNQWSSSNNVSPVLLPLIVTNLIVEHNRRLQEISVAHAYPKHSKVFAMLPSWQGFGYPALVDSVDNDGRVRLTVSIWPTVDLGHLRDSYEEMRMQWMNCFEAGRRIGVDGRLLSRITGTVFLLVERSQDEEGSSPLRETINIGLSLKLSRKNQEVPDYTRRLENGYWQYSILCLQLLNSYKKKFRDVFSFLEKADTTDDVYRASDIWKNKVKREERVEELKKWLASVPTQDIEKQDGGVEYADRFIIGHIENAIKQVPKKRWVFRKCSVNPNVLYRAELYEGKSCPDSDADFKLLDRVVHCVQGTGIPFGLQGTVVGLYSTKVDVLFDQEFNSGYKIRGMLNSGARLSKSSLINISYGKERKGQSVGTQNRKDRPHLDSKTKRSFAGKHNTTTLHKQNIGTSRTCSSVEDKRLSLPGKPRKVQILKANPTSCAASQTIVQKHVGLSKQDMGNELTRILGIMKSKAISNRDTKEPLTKLNVNPFCMGKICDSIEDNAAPVTTESIPSAALKKLFPRTTNTDKKTITGSKALTPAVCETSRKSTGVHSNVTPFRSHKSATYSRGKGGKIRTPAVQALPRDLPPTAMSSTFYSSSNVYYCAPNRLHSNEPKLTDLKPSSIILPGRKYRSRRGGRQATYSAHDNSVKREEESVAVESSSAAASKRVFTNTRARRIRKSRLATNFSKNV